MVRPRNSIFLTTTPMLKKESVAAINWGLIDGKTNTKCQWDVPIANGSDPQVWFHEVFRKDGTPYKMEETTLLKQLNGKQRGA